MKTKILFIPHPMASHIIPLASLAKMLSPESYQMTFLLPKEFHSHIQNLGFQTFEMDRQWNDELMKELMTIEAFRPDILVDDLNFYTGFSSRVHSIPRVSIVRTGILPNEQNTPGYEHSSGLIKHFDKLKSFKLYEENMWEPQSKSDLFVGDVNILPAIPSIEKLPDKIPDKQSYFYSGPLVLNDLDMTATGVFSDDMFKLVSDFLSRNEDRKKIYFTIGLGQPEVIYENALTCLQHLLDKGHAVITNIENFEPHEEVAAQCFYAPFVPMNQVCRNVDLMIHQCGSATYNYQLQHTLPAIVLGSKCYDRDDIAIRLDEVNAAEYISADLDRGTYHDKFINSVQRLLFNKEKIDAMKKILCRLKGEIQKVQEEFDFDEIINTLLSKHHNSKTKTKVL
ncbi:hypothetical protein [Fulvivirga sp.]|uniref:glycosyltransferase n=1 Tax=Fulvivirga sp. TaxID=1931237 RepID=UPI0032EB0E1E